MSGSHFSSPSEFPAVPQSPGTRREVVLTPEDSARHARPFSERRKVAYDALVGELPITLDTFVIFLYEHIKENLFGPEEISLFLNELMPEVPDGSTLKGLSIGFHLLKHASNLYQQMTFPANGDPAFQSLFPSEVNLDFNTPDEKGRKPLEIACVEHNKFLFLQLVLFHRKTCGFNTVYTEVLTGKRPSLLNRVIKSKSLFARAEQRVAMIDLLILFGMPLDLKDEGISKAEYKPVQERLLVLKGMMAALRAQGKSHKDVPAVLAERMSYGLHSAQHLSDDSPVIHLINRLKSFLKTAHSFNSFVDEWREICREFSPQDLTQAMNTYNCESSQTYAVCLLRKASKLFNQDPDHLKECAFERLIPEYINVNFKCRSLLDGLTPLMQACQSADSYWVRQLILFHRHICGLNEVAFNSEFDMNFTAMGCLLQARSKFNIDTPSGAEKFKESQQVKILLLLSDMKYTEDEIAAFGVDSKVMSTQKQIWQDKIDKRIKQMRTSPDAAIILLAEDTWTPATGKVDAAERTVESACQTFLSDLDEIDSDPGSTEYKWNSRCEKAIKACGLSSFNDFLRSTIDSEMVLIKLLKAFNESGWKVYAPLLFEEEVFKAEFDALLKANHSIPSPESSLMTRGLLSLSIWRTSHFVETYISEYLSSCFEDGIEDLMPLTGMPEAHPNACNLYYSTSNLYEWLRGGQQNPEILTTLPNGELKEFLRTIHLIDQSLGSFRESEACFSFVVADAYTLQFFLKNPSEALLNKLLFRLKNLSIPPNRIAQLFGQVCTRDQITHFREKFPAFDGLAKQFPEFLPSEEEAVLASIYRDFLAGFNEWKKMSVLDENWEQKWTSIAANAYLESHAHFAHIRHFGDFLKCSLGSTTILQKLLQSLQTSEEWDSVRPQLFGFIKEADWTELFDREAIVDSDSSLLLVKGILSCDFSLFVPYVKGPVSHHFNEAYEREKLKRLKSGTALSRNLIMLVQNMDFLFGSERGTKFLLDNLSEQLAANNFLKNIAFLSKGDGFYFEEKAQYFVHIAYMAQALLRAPTKKLLSEILTSLKSLTFSDLEKLEFLIHLFSQAKNPALLLALNPYQKLAAEYQNSPELSEVSRAFLSAHLLPEPTAPAPVFESKTDEQKAQEATKKRRKEHAQRAAAREAKAKAEAEAEKEREDAAKRQIARRKAEMGLSAKSSGMGRQAPAGRGGASSKPKNQGKGKAPNKGSKQGSKQGSKKGSAKPSNPKTQAAKSNPRPQAPKLKFEKGFAPGETNLPMNSGAASGPIVTTKSAMTITTATPVAPVPRKKRLSNSEKRRRQNLKGKASNMLLLTQLSESDLPIGAENLTYCQQAQLHVHALDVMNTFMNIKVDAYVGLGCDLLTHEEFKQRAKRVRDVLAHMPVFRGELPSEPAGWLKLVNDLSGRTSAEATANVQAHFGFDSEWFNPSETFNDLKQAMLACYRQLAKRLPSDPPKPGQMTLQQMTTESCPEEFRALRGLAVQVLCCRERGLLVTGAQKQFLDQLVKDRNAIAHEPSYKWTKDFGAVSVPQTDSRRSDKPVTWNLWLVIDEAVKKGTVFTSGSAASGSSTPMFSGLLGGAGGEVPTPSALLSWGDAPQSPVAPSSEFSRK